MSDAMIDDVLYKRVNIKPKHMLLTDEQFVFVCNMVIENDMSKLVDFILISSDYKGQRAYASFILGVRDKLASLSNTANIFTNRSYCRGYILDATIELTELFIECGASKSTFRNMPTYSAVQRGNLNKTISRWGGGRPERILEFFVPLVATLKMLKRGYAIGENKCKI